MCTVCSKLISALHLWLITCICVFGGASIVAVVINRLLISLETLAIRRVVHAIQWVQSVRIYTLLCFSFSYLLFDAKNAKAKKKNHRRRNCYNECSLKDIWISICRAQRLTHIPPVQIGVLQSNFRGGGPKLNKMHLPLPSSHPSGHEARQGSLQRMDSLTN